MIKPTKEDLIRLYVDENKSSREIAEIYGVTDKAIYKYFKKFSVVVKKVKKDIQDLELFKELVAGGASKEKLMQYFKVSSRSVNRALKAVHIKTTRETNLNVITKDFLIEQYINKSLTIRQISKITGVKTETIGKRLKLYSISRVHWYRKYNTQKQVVLTDEQKDLIIGTMLGDGHITKRINGSCALKLGHCIKQKAFLEWKHDFVKNISRGIQESTDKRGIKSIGFSTITHKELEPIHKLFYDAKKRKIITNELLDKITPFSLAIWIMDDGSCGQKRNIRIHTDCFNYAEHLLMKEWFKKKFDLDVGIYKTFRKKYQKLYYYLAFNKENSIKLSKIIKPYVIDSMKYKLVDFV